MFACIHAPGNLELLLKCAGHFSPSVEVTSADTVVFDIRGLRLIFGTPDHIAGEIHRRVGLPANIALASNPDAASHAARGIKGVTVIEPGQEPAVLAPLPLHLLGGPPEFAQVMDTWGIRTFGEFANLPPLGVAARLGDQGLSLQRLARGEGTRLLKTQSGTLEFHQEMEPETPIDLLEPLMFLLAQMIEELCGRMRASSLSTNEIHLLLKLEKAPDHPVTVRLPLPLLDPKVFLKLLQLELNDRPPQAPVEKIRLELKPVEPRTTQHGLFLPSSPQPEKLEITLARIRHLVGANNVGAAELIDTHRPDSFRLGPLSLAPQGHEPAATPQVGLRRFRPPLAAQVFLTSEGQPARLFSSKAEGRVIACAGPWRTSGDWWVKDPWDHEEWDVEISSGMLLRIYLDRSRKRWFVEGSYD